METIDVPVMARKAGNKRDAGRLRRKGQLPGIVYRAGKVAEALAVDGRELHSRVQSLDGSHLIKLQSTDSALNGRIVLIRDVQYHPVTHDVLHLDLYEVDLTQKTTVMVPVNYVGRPVGVVNGGVLQSVAREIEVECLPTDIPGELEVDVSGLEIGDSLKSEDIVLPPDVSITTPGVALATVLQPTVVEEPEEEAAEEEAAEEEGEAESEEPTESKEESKEE